MGKRGAEDQLTKDDVEGGRGGRDDSDDENNVARDAPKEVLAARQIRGIPKRKMAAAAPAPTPAFGFGQPSASTTTPSFGAPVSTRAFSFGSVPAAKPSSFAASAPAAPSVFGDAAKTAPSTTPAAVSNTPFSGFSFSTSAVSSTPVSAANTSGSAPSSAFSSTATTSQLTTSNTASATKTPFSAFSFAAPATSAKTDSPASTLAFAPATADKGLAFGAFGNSSAKNSTSAFGATSVPIEPSKAVDLNKAVNGSSSTTVTSSQPQVPKEDEKEIEYLTSVRGLNESVVRALSVKVRDDPFINLASALESLKAEYNTYLEEISKKAGKSMPANGVEIQTKKRDAAAMDDSSNIEPPNKKTADANKPSLSMPAPPPSMPSAGGFKLPPPSSSTSSSTASGFKPVLPTAPSDSAKPGLPAVGGFKLPSSTASSTPQSGSGPAGFKPTLPSTESAPAKPSPFAGFSFGPTAEKKDASPTTSTAGAGVSSVPFPTFGAAASTAGGKTAETTEKRPSSRASLFAQAVIDEQKNEKTAEKETPATPSSSSKQSSIFAIKPTVKPAIAETMVVPSPSSSTGASSFLFKAPSTPSATASTTPSKLPTFSFNMGSTDNPPTPKTGFSFAPKPRATSATFGFAFGKTDSPEKSGVQDVNGKTDSTSTTTSKPVGSAFSFGPEAPRASPKQPSLPHASTTGNIVRPTFSFGPTSTAFTSPKPVATSTDAPATSTDSEEAPADAGPQADLTVGAGEEDEETLWQGKVSVGSFGKFGAEGAAPTWGDWKTCILKLNKEKNPSSGEQPMRRILARVDPSGTIVQNFSLRSLVDMSQLTESAFKMTVAGSDGLKQVAIRFGKKKEGFDPTPLMDKLKAAIQSERSDMTLPSLPSLK